jgi:hypothetical protein
MIFKKLEDADIVAGRTTRVASGFWPNGFTNASQSFFASDFWSLTGSVGNPSYGTSYYDVRRTMYYLNVFPTNTEMASNDPYFSISYGNFYGNLGSGSFAIETSSIMTSPSKAVYTQYQNMLLGSADLDGQFSFKSGSTTVNADDIWAISFSTYKMKDRIDEGLIELSFSGANDIVTLIDDSYYTNQSQASYQMIEGTLLNQPSSPTYGGLGILYPQNGVVILNAKLLAIELGLWTVPSTTYPDGQSTGNTISDGTNSYTYNPGLDSSLTYTTHHKLLFESMRLCATKTMKVRKSEYVPARHYFVRVKNRDFNYSNNPTYVYDGTDGIHARGTIRNNDFIDDPRTYITTVGLYNDNNELVAVAKLSRPAIKTFDTELLLKVRLDF